MVRPMCPTVRSGGHQLCGLHGPQADAFLTGWRFKSRVTICNKLVPKGREFLLTWGTGVAVGGPRPVLSPHAQVEQSRDQGYTLPVTQ